MTVMAGTVAARVQYGAWRAVSAVVERMPAQAAYALATGIGTTGYYLWPRARRAMHSNYSRVLPGVPKTERHRVARRSLVNYCKYLVDFIRFPKLTPTAIVEAVEGAEEFASLDRALNCGRGAVVVCMHFGNWDLGAGAAAARGYPLTVVAESFADDRLDAMVAGSRERLGMRLVKMDKAGPSLLRALKANGLLALLIDRAVPGDGVRVTFFDEEVEVPAGPARLALRTGAAVVAAAFVRSHPNRQEVKAHCDFSIRPQKTGDRDCDIQLLTQAIMSAHERFIRQYPDQWYMFRPMWESAGSGP